MLSRKSLLPLRQEFPKIRQQGRFYNSPYFGLLINSGGRQTEGAQCAFIVSKKVSKSSVTRHEVKRKLAEATKTFLPRLPHRTQLVFLVKATATDVSASKLQEQIDILLRRAKLLS